MGIKRFGQLVDTTVMTTEVVIDKSLKSTENAINSVFYTTAMVSESLKEGVIDSVKERLHSYNRAVESFETPEKQQAFIEAMNYYRL